MYLRDVKKIRFGGVRGALVPYGIESTYEWKIKSMKRRTPKILELECVDLSGHHFSKFNIKAEHESVEKILDGIESHKEVLGKSMNQLRDTLVEDIL